MPEEIGSRILQVCRRDGQVCDRNGVHRRIVENDGVASEERQRHEDPVTPKLVVTSPIVGVPESALDSWVGVEDPSGRIRKTLVAGFLRDFIGVNQCRHVHDVVEAGAVSNAPFVRRCRQEREVFGRVGGARILESLVGLVHPVQDQPLGIGGAKGGLASYCRVDYQLAPVDATLGDQLGGWARAADERASTRRASAPASCCGGCPSDSRSSTRATASRRAAGPSTCGRATCGAAPCRAASPSACGRATCGAAPRCAAGPSAGRAARGAAASCRAADCSACRCATRVACRAAGCSACGSAARVPCRAAGCSAFGSAPRVPRRAADCSACDRAARVARRPARYHSSASAA